MPVQFKQYNFPRSLICECGSNIAIRNAILESDRQKSSFDEEFCPDEYFSGFFCNNCSDYVWYVLLDYHSDIREIRLIQSEPYHISVPNQDEEILFDNTREVYDSLKLRYKIHLDFPANKMVTAYIRKHHVSDIFDEISPLLPMVVLQPQNSMRGGKNQDFVLVIPYRNDGELLGELKVNFNLSAGDREEIKELCFGFWDLIIDHYFGAIHEVKWDIEEIFQSGNEDIE